MTLRTTLFFVTLFSLRGALAEQTSKNVVPKEVFSRSIYSAFFSPLLPPVGSERTMFVADDPIIGQLPILPPVGQEKKMFVVQEPITEQSPIYVSPVRKEQPTPGKVDEHAKTLPSK